MSRNTKQRLLAQGLTSFTTNGFNNTGIQNLLQELGVPKGSFYHHFANKNDFGQQVVRYYSELMTEQIKNIFTDTEKTPLARLAYFFDQHQEQMLANGYKGGCLIGNMSQEMGDLCPDFEKLLESQMAGLADGLTAVITEAQALGEIPANLEPHILANFIVNSWQGALLRMKVCKNSSPHDAFRTMVFQHLLVPCT